MQNQNIPNKQPGQPKAAGGPAPGLQSIGSQPGRQQPKRRPLWASRRARIIIGALLFLLALGVIVLGGALAGYQSGMRSRLGQQTQTAGLTLQEQFDLGVKDLQEGRYEVARQRFEYIITQDPAYPGVTEKLAEAMAVLYATATPTALPATITPTPTRDLRPVQEMFQQAVSLVANQQWTQAIDTLNAVRKADPAYQVARVDGLMFLSLRQRGVDKIWKEGSLEGGIYDLALAARFGPLDVQANSARELARLYIIGSSFWEVHPEQAVFYFSQVAAAAPGLRDSSGITASERYFGALIQYGDLLAKQKDWCGAQAQYELALAIRADATLQEKLNNAIQGCTPTSPTPELSGTPTATIPGATVPPWTPTPTATQIVPGQPTDTPTPTQPLPSTPTDTQVVPPSPTPSETPPAPPEPTATFTSEAPPPASAEYSPAPAWPAMSLGFSLQPYWQQLLILLNNLI
jgi:tetratricopeptide (TPR) repeat protein